MKKERFKFSGWLSKSLLLLLMLLLSGGQLHASGNIVNSTKNIATQNYENVKQSAKDLLEELEAMRDDLDKMKNDGLDIWKDGGEGVSEALDKLHETFRNVRNMDLDGLKNMDLDDIKDIVKEISNKVKEGQSTTNDLTSRFNGLGEKVSTLVNSVKNIANFAYTMPVGIRSDNLNFEISVDKLTDVREDENSGAVRMDAHAHWRLPFTSASCDDPVNLGFKGSIVLRGTGTSRISIDPTAEGSRIEKNCITYTLSKNKLYLDLDSSCYVAIDCNGFKEMYLKGAFRFSSQIITKADMTGETDSMVSASFEAYIDDLTDFFVEASIDKPFKVKATEDVIYEANGIVADFSTTRNASNFAFPQSYINPFKPGDENYWTGFAIKTLKVDLSKQFPEFPLDSVAAHNMLIDETGVSGWFNAGISAGGSNSAKKGEQKKNSTIEASFTEISVGLSGGKISGGGLTGTVKIIPLKDSRDSSLTLGIAGKLYSDRNGHLNFDIKTEVKKDMVYNLPIIKTTKITLGQGTYFQFQHVTDTTTEEKKYDNIFTLVVNGGLDVDNNLVQIKGLKFEGLKLCSASPHFNAGKFSLNGVDMPALHGLPFGLKSLGAKTNSKNEAILQPKIYLTLIGKESTDDDKQGASVEAGFDLVSTIKDDGDRPGWKITGLRLNSIKVDINYSAFHLLGEVNGFKDDPVMGDGFGGGIEFSMKTPKLRAAIKANFGKTKYDFSTGGQLNDYYKYWYVYGSCDMPPGIVLFPPAVYLKSVSISAYSRVTPLFDVKKFEVTKVTPNKGNKFGFTAGIGFYAAQQSMIDAKVQMGMDFSSSGGISRIGLDGLVGILGKDDGGDFNKSFMTGTVSCVYDFENEIFKADIGAEAGPAISDIVKGSALLKIRTYPKSWYCRLGTYDDPVSLTFVKKINARTYLMFGDSIPTTLPPLDPKISALFEVTQSTATSSDHSEMFNNGTGFAFGVALSLDCHLNKFVYADLVFLGGTDLLVVRGKDVPCGGDGSRYRAKGQVYVYLAAGAGIKFRKKKFEIVEFEAAADLMGEVPKPVYIEGNIAFKYRVLGGLVSGHAHAKYSHGVECKPGSTDSGVFHDSNVYGEEEDQKAQDDKGRDLNESDWEY